MIQSIRRWWKQRSLLKTDVERRARALRREHDRLLRIREARR